MKLCRAGSSRHTTGVVLVASGSAGKASALALIASDSVGSLRYGIGPRDVVLFVAVGQRGVASHFLWCARVILGVVLDAVRAGKLFGSETKVLDKLFTGETGGALTKPFCISVGNSATTRAVDSVNRLSLAGLRLNRHDDAVLPTTSISSRHLTGLHVQGA